MGKTYNKQSKKFEEDFGGRSGKPAKHASGKKTGGMRTLNSYVDEEDYDDPFDDDVGIEDEIFITHIRQDDTN
jgi:hypothetical protein